MILTTALFGIKEVIMLLVIVFAISYFTVKALTAADNKDRAKAMKDPINVAKEMGLEISPKYEKDNEILAYGKNYAFVMRYFPTKGTYRRKQLLVCQKRLISKPLRHLRVGFIILGKKIEVLVRISEKRLSAADIHEGLGRDHAVRNDPVSGKILHPTPAKRSFLFIGEL